jgi:hypothetical protein
MDDELKKILEANGVDFDDINTMAQELVDDPVEVLSEDISIKKIVSKEVSSSVPDTKVCDNDSENDSDTDQSVNTLPKPSNPEPKISSTDSEKRIYTVDLSRVPTALAVMMADDLGLKEHLDDIKKYLTQPMFQCIFQKRMDKSTTEHYRQSCINLKLPVKMAKTINSDETCKGVIGKGLSARPCTKPAKEEFNGYCGLHKNLVNDSVSGSIASTVNSTTHRCSSFTKGGVACGKNIKLCETFCVLHRDKPILTHVQKIQERCKGFTGKKMPCNRFPTKDSEYCPAHSVLDTKMLQTMMDNIEV